MREGPAAIVIPFPTKTKVYRTVRPKHPSGYAAAPDLLDLCWVCQVNTAEHDENGLCEECR